MLRKEINTSSRAIILYLKESFLLQKVAENYTSNVLIVPQRLIVPHLQVWDNFNGNIDSGKFNSKNIIEGDIIAVAKKKVVLYFLAKKISCF